MKLILVAILAGSLAGCASVQTEYNRGCVDGVEGLRGQLRSEVGAILAEPDMIGHYCDSVEFRHKQKPVREKP